MRPRITVLLSIVLTMLLGPAFAQVSSDQPIRIVSPFAAGGTNDALARLVGKHLGERWGRPVIVENRPGGSGMVAAELVAKSRPDSITMLMGSSTTHGANPLLYKTLPYDAERDFTPLAAVAQVAIVLVVNPANPARNLKEFIANAKASNARVNLGTNGIGSAAHMASELFSEKTGVAVENIVYKGDAPMMADVTAGHLTGGFPVVPVVTGQLAAGTLRALAVTSLTRTRVLPNVPTIAESGYPGTEFIAWFGLLASSKLPPEIATRLAKDITDIVSTPEVSALILQQGADPLPLGGADFAKYIMDQRQKYAAIIKSAGIKVE